MRSLVINSFAGAVESEAAQWSSGDLGLLLQEAVADHNDVEGVSWRRVALDVAAALGVSLSDVPLPATSPCGSDLGGRA